MSMHQGLDLSRFKKVSSDKNATTLRHGKGHEIKIAHSGLTPKMREELDKLPSHEEIRHFAEGGDTAKKGFVEEDLDGGNRKVFDAPAAPEPDKEAAPTPAPAPAPAPAPSAQEQDQPTNTEKNNAAPAAPRKQPVQSAPLNLAQENLTPEPPPPTTAQIAQQMVDNDLSFQQDMAMGRIKPETYKGLYAKEDTLGKISTLFGLLVGGMGSGLTGQPNALLSMMDKTIMNDLEAQKASNVNAQNWLRLSQAHEMNQAQIELTRAQASMVPSEIALRTAQAGQIPSEIALRTAQAGAIPSEIEERRAKMKNLPAERERLRAEAGHLKADADLLGTQSAINKMKIGAVQSLTPAVQNMPPGPAKDAHIQGLKTLNDGVNASILDGNAKVAAQVNARQTLRKPAKAQPAAIDNGTDLAKLTALSNEMKAYSNLGMATKIDPTEMSQIYKESQDVADNRAAARMYNDSFRKLANMALAGTLNPEMQKAELATLSASIARETAGRFNLSEAEMQKGGMFPSFKDWGGAREEKYRKGMEFFRGKEASAVTMDRFGLHTPFPYKAAEGKEALTPSKYEGKTAIDKKTGDRLIMTDGKWVPVK